MKQKGYIQNILSEFDMAEAKGQNIPMAHGTSLVYDGIPDTVFEYRKAVGCLLWLARGTRPDIAQAVSKVSRFVENPTTIHTTAVKRIFRYVKHTSDTQLVYQPSEAGIIAYVDADHAGCEDTRRSTSGHWVTWNDMPITWNSKRKGMVTLSTTESELVAAVECVKDMKWMKNVLIELEQMKQDDKMILYEDNQATITNLKNRTSKGRNKHIDIKYHYVCEQIENDIIDVIYIESEMNIADIFTKPLAYPAFKKHFESMFRTRGGDENESRQLEMKTVSTDTAVVSTVCIKEKTKLEKTVAFEDHKNTAEKSSMLSAVDTISQHRGIYGSEGK